MVMFAANAERHDPIGSQITASGRLQVMQ